MADFDIRLGTRPLARQHRAAIERKIKAAKDDLIIIAMERVFISLSYSDELFASLVERAQRGEYGDHRWIIFRGTDVFSEEILDEALHRRGLAAALADRGTLRLIGVKEKRVVQAFNWIEKARRATTRDLATKMRISVPATNKWVGKLVDARVVRREEVGKGSGRPFEYFSRAPEVVGAGVR